MLLVQVSGWDKTDAISSVIAAATGLILVVGVVCPLVRGWWSTRQSKRAASLETGGYAFVGVKHEETLIVRLSRTVFCQQPGVGLRDATTRGHTNFEIPGVRCWTDGWFDAEGNPHKFPKRLNRGDELRTTLSIQAEQAWKGVICVEAFDEGRCAFQVRKPFEVQTGPSPRATQVP